MTLTEYQLLRRKEMSEEELLACIIKTAHLFGWLACHQRPMRTKDGEWRTGVQGDKGFPDIVLVNETKLLIIEAKSEIGKLALEQEEWIRRLRLAHYKNGVLVLRPSDWFSGKIESILSGEGE